MDKKNKLFLTHKKCFIGILIFFGAVSLGTIYYFYHASAAIVFSDGTAISTYNEQRDYADVFNLFKRNLYFLSADPQHPIEYVLKNKTPYQNPLYWNTLHIDVIRSKEGKFIGFIAYHKLSAHEGRILFLGIDEEQRGKRYGQYLTEYAIKQLVAQGAQSILLATRINNYSGQKLYQRLGFYEESRYDGFIHYKYIS